MALRAHCTAEGCRVSPAFCLLRCPCSGPHAMWFLRLVSFTSTVFPRSLQGVGRTCGMRGFRAFPTSQDGVLVGDSPPESLGAEVMTGAAAAFFPPG